MTRRFLTALPRHAPRLALLLALGCTACGQQANPAPQGEQQQYSYALGVELAQAIEARHGAVDVQWIHRAIDDVLQQHSASLDADQARAVIRAYEDQRAAELEPKRQSVAARQLAEGEAFLQRNGQRAGIKTTTRGVQYEVLVQGEGPQPIETDQLMLHYSGSLIDGTVFDSTRQQPTPLSIALPLTLPGWREVLPLMPVGSKYRLYIPGPLAFAGQGLADQVPPQATVIYDIELLGIVR